MLSNYPQDRRKRQRISARLAAVCRITGPQKYMCILNGNDFEAKTEEMSEGGLSLISNYFVPPGAMIYIKLMVCESDRKTYVKFYDIVRLYGEVTNTTVRDDHTFRLGVEFTDLTQDKEDKIFYIMHSSLQEGGPSHADMSYIGIEL